MDPVYYNYKLPKDYDFPEEYRSKVDDFARKHNLSNEVMQEAIDLHVEVTEDYSKRLMKAIKRLAFIAGAATAVIGLSLYLIF